MITTEPATASYILAWACDDSAIARDCAQVPRHVAQAPDAEVGS